MKDETMKPPYMSLDDKTLVDKTIAGDYKAFEEIVSRYKDKVFSLALAITMSRDLAEDATQEVFVKAYFALPKFKFQSNLFTWLSRIAMNTSYNILKKERRHKTVDIDLALYNNELSVGKNQIKIENSDEKGDFSQGIIKRAMLDEILKGLPEKYRVPLVLREFQNMRYDEISRAIGISVQQVKIRIYRARQKTRKILDGKNFGGVSI